MIMPSHLLELYIGRSYNRVGDLAFKVTRSDVNINVYVYDIDTADVVRSQLTVTRHSVATISHPAVTEAAAALRRLTPSHVLSAR